MCGNECTRGSLKVFASLSKYLDERRLYRRDERDQIVKDHDHLQDALRCLVSGVSWMRTKPQPAPAVPSRTYPRVMRLDEVTFYSDRALIRGSDVS